MTKDSCYVIGTISNGLYAFSKEGHLLWKENADNQLENNTVLGLYCDMDNNIWTALDNGIAYVRNNSLIYHFEPVRRKVGMVYDVLVRDKDAYIASNQGLYRLEDTHLELVPGLEEQAWTIGEWGGRCFAVIIKVLSRLKACKPGFFPMCGGLCVCGRRRSTASNS